MMQWRGAFTAAALGIVGCEMDSNSHLRNPDYVRSEKPPVFDQANLQAATRVDSLGRTILAANPRIAGRPLFRTIGSPEPEIFHNSNTDIYITQGMVDRCQTDAELAAVLCYELGRMVAEREALLTPEERRARVLPPLDAGLPRDVAGASTEPDQFRLMELARFQKERDRELAQTPPEPEALARVYLKRAGFAATDLDHVKPQLSQAAKNSTLAKQMTSSPVLSSNSPFLPPGQ